MNWENCRWPKHFCRLECRSKIEWVSFPDEKCLRFVTNRSNTFFTNPVKEEVKLQNNRLKTGINMCEFMSICFIVFLIVFFRSLPLFFVHTILLFVGFEFHPRQRTKKLKSFSKISFFCCLLHLKDFFCCCCQHHSSFFFG